MKERPILFSAPMVRAILEGRKTQTRRVVSRATMFGDKTQDLDGYSPTILEPNNAGNVKWQWAKGAYFASHPHPLTYGQPGDRLWVKETAWWGFDGLDGEDFLGFVADAEPVYCPQHPEAIRASQVFKRPSIFMSRAESRITLELTAVRVERLHDITERDAWAEGIQIKSPNEMPSEDSGPWVAVPAYRALWESINGPGSWDANPWVWVVDFKRVTP